MALVVRKLTGLLVNKGEESSHLGIAEAQTTQLTGYLQTKCPQFLETLQSLLLHLLQGVILGRVIHFLGKE